MVHEGKITALIILTSLTLDVIPSKSRHALESIAAQIGGAIVRLQAEAERDEQRRMLRTLLDTLPGFVVFKDRDSMYRMCNQKVCDFWRMSEEEMIGKTDSDLLPPEDAIICRQEELYVMSTREILTADHKLAGPDGTVYWHESIKVPLQNEQGEIIGVLITDWDITERREVEAERDEQRRMVQAMLATTPDIVTFKDRSMAFKITSESFRRLMAPDRTADELVGCSDFDVFPQELAQRYLGEEVEVLMSGKTVIAEHQVETCEGSRWLEAIKMPLRDENGEIVGLFTSERDITERRRAENERDEQRRMLRTLLDAMPDVVLFKDKDLRYVVANKKYCDMYGLSEKELVGKTDFEVMLLADDAERFRREDLRVLEGETVLERHECQTPWGPRWDESIRVPLRDDRGEIIGVVVAARDITERIHMEEDRDAQQRMLRALLDHLPHHILFKDRDLVYRVINQGYCDFFERPMGQLIGATDLDVWPEEDAHHYMEGERRLLETGEPIRMEKFTETRWGPNWREVIKNPLRDSAGNIIGILVAAHDITALKLADKQLRRRNEELSALNAISTAINQSLEPEFILKTALTEVLALDMIGAEGRGEVFLITQEGEALLIAQHGLPQAYLDNAELRGKYLCNLVQQHEHVVISDGETYEEGDVHGAGNLPHCNLSLLLRSRERVLGCINLWLPASKTLAQDDFLFLNSISDRISMAVENAHLYEDVRQQNLEIRALSRQVIENSEDERKRIAQDLHDMTGQYLTALGINLNIIKQNLTPDMWDKTMPRLEDCTNLVERTTDYIRGVMADLRPPALDDYGLFAALMWLRDRFVKQADIQIDFIGQPLSERLAPHMEITLFRIAQEALTNVMKHAKASRVEVTLEESDGLIVLQVKDNGVGFDSTQPVTPYEKGGWGLLSIKEWMSGFGGIFEVKSAPGEGTLLRVEWPRQ